jgi:hypothetical protein
MRDMKTSICFYPSLLLLKGGKQNRTHCSNPLFIYLGAVLGFELRAYDLARQALYF